MSDKSLRASKADAVKTSAEQDLKAALSYIEDAEAPFFDKRRRLTLDDTPELFATLDKAAKYVVAARAKNNQQTLVLDDAKTGPITFTLDDIAGAISHREGHIALVAWRTALNDVNKSIALQRARGAFEKATKFCPDRSEYFVNLANVCCLMGDKSAAVESIGVSLKLNPDDAEAIKLNGEIEELPDPIAQKTVSPRQKQSHPILYPFLSGVGCFIFVAITMPRQPPFRGPIPEGVLALLIFVGLALCTVPTVLKFLAWKNYNEYEGKRLQQDAARMRDEIYEERYQAKRERRVE